ncbi:MAG: metal ABC transporter permease [Candidatus Riflebacteria bacterium]|nr:metal ABC transporter permease [Candidatus Riflebacteria bacterium]
MQGRLSLITFFYDLLEMPFLQYAIIGSLLSSLACGIVGSFVVVKRISYIAAGISHCILGGMGAARYLQVVHGLTWCKPVFGAILSAIAAALAIGWVSLKTKEREDTAISALWAVGMATGVIFISRTPGYNEDLMSYLFGNIMMISMSDIYTIIILDVIILVICFLFYHQFVAVCFDEEFSQIRGLNVQFYYYLLLCLTAITVVLLTTVVGIILVIALLTLPVAVASRFSSTLRQLMVYSVFLCAFFTVFGIAVSYSPNLPASSTTVVIAGITYLVSSLVSFSKQS